ncbi:N-acetylglucosaminyl transferase [Campylobacter blaseri]|uniref:UDP-N-acetylglucosamine--N-acetylmuramyl-(pentapeptide) pyrophosphoryl-undecaprenol N-acetylglucosamine transferase n=1 Tax=Campylobacter blaseri TaxID=2042961 RepID=A0A2P8R2J4_9BACT|nr:undecaprenyldiphospho-muramoylpentapeptide beta-N-acetylglucosaminyltransferase [Campylobacter blaseri]PSM52709.1 undecaprenyldiphospho-muramoylpentapeptide beta-N-acetylglucosaminyltransferase [Campylobacter blaseri]PSM54357.1 undecaprenyldiphospho-muramoylpentapeptide beta-N-acetylglucosaminyltransferase [Campylobacter blaseri]QKF86010.1 N-acetylglucosaminyl transferase [Campylobacter blaseri]
MIAITGGGTGGHLVIAKTIATELKNRGIKAIFIGSTYGQDREWFENCDFFEEKYFLKSTGVVNKKGLSKIKSLFNIVKLSFKCKQIFKKHNIKAVFSVGGYSSSPASFWAVFSKTPLFIHEQNAKIGRLNKLLKPFAKNFYNSYEKTKFNYPVKSEVFEKARRRDGLKTIIFLGGSQGARFINNLAMNIAFELKEKNINIIHQCGKLNYNKVSEFYKNNGIHIDLFDFSNELASKMQEADLCIGRSGASTLWELCANLLPAIFIPLPSAANDHQFYNAKFLMDLGLAKVYREDEISKEKILNEIFNYDIIETSRGLESVIEQNGSRQVVDDMLNLLDNCK